MIIPILMMTNLEPGALEERGHLPNHFHHHDDQPLAWLSKNSASFLIILILILKMTNLEPGSLEHLLHLALVHVVRQVGDVSSERWSSWDPAGKWLKQINKPSCFCVTTNKA